MAAPLEERLHAEMARAESESPMTRALTVLLRDAEAANVSDIHINPDAEGLGIYYRSDGVLLPKARIGADRSGQFIRKVKVMASLLTYRTDTAQDGQIPADAWSGTTDIRVSSFPTIHGEKIVLRMFLHGSDLFSLPDLGLPATIADRLKESAARPDGVMLLTGPSGSGKTTTIYSLLHGMTRPDQKALRHVVTIEDPVEHEIPGVTQTQVNPDSGMTFSSSLRSLLRQDPQVIMVGEIRDRETARVAMEAGLTGHLVISTIHSGTAAGVITRLMEMGVEPHVLTASLSCVLAQRLVRRRCCDDGCDNCHGTGYLGRHVFAEMLVVDERIREAIGRRVSREEMEALAVSGGMIPLRDEGERLVKEGVTTPDELRRVLG